MEDISAGMGDSLRTPILRRSPRLAVVHHLTPISYKEMRGQSDTSYEFIEATILLKILIGIYHVCIHLRGTPVNRRSPRLATLHVLTPITYKETKAPRVFKKVHRRPGAVAPVEDWTDVQTQPRCKNCASLLVVVAVLILAIFAGLGLKMMSEQSSKTLDSPGNPAIENTSGGDQILENFQESADGLHELPAQPGHEAGQPEPDVCDNLDPFLWAQNFLSIVHEMFGKDSRGSSQEENFALRSSGASVVRRSKPFYTGIKLCGLGFCWDYSRSPDIILERSLEPGNCWAMDGAQGYVVIKLSEPISPTFVKLGHISAAASSHGTISSAPRQFAIYGLRDAFEQEEEGNLLGSFVYKNNGYPVQEFQLKRSKEDQFPYLMVKILSNHGHPDYTCIYSVCVHGQRIHRISYNENEDLDQQFQLVNGRLSEWFSAI